MQRVFGLLPSRLLSLSIILLCIAALVSLWLLPFALPWQLAATALVLVWGGYVLLSDAHLRLNRSCVAFRLEEDRGIALALRDGRHVSGRMYSDSLVTPYIVILNVALNGVRNGRRLLILPDAMDRESFRRLRVVLRWGD